MNYTKQPKADYNEVGQSELKDVKVHPVAALGSHTSDEWHDTRGVYSYVESSTAPELDSLKFEVKI